MRRIVLVSVAGLLVLLVLALAFIWQRGTREEFIASPSSPGGADELARGQYLAAAGDCMACHTLRGGTPYAGGRAIATPFGTIYTPNITQDVATGIGTYSADDLWRALHNGIGKDGRFLYPAFPFTNYTKVTRADSDALYAYLRTLAPKRAPARAPELRFPYNQRLLLVVWRALYFTPGQWQPDAARSPAWNRGAYLAQALGHCDACHADRNLLGATDSALGLSGGQIPIMNWYAPSLLGASEAGLKDWPEDDLVSLLRTGVSARATIFGPMAEVVEDSLQYLDTHDLEALATYLKDAPLPSHEPLQTNDSEAVLAEAPARARGAAIYREHCSDCHGEDGQGVARIYPPLAGNRAILMSSPTNPIRIVLMGGFGPVTAGNPRPYGMPPFAQELHNQEIAEVVSYIRSSWGNHASPVTSVEVDRYQGAPFD